MTGAPWAARLAAIAQLVEHLICNQGNPARFQSLECKRKAGFPGFGKTRAFRRKTTRGSVRTCPRPLPEVMAAIAPAKRAGEVLQAVFRVPVAGTFCSGGGEIA